MYNEKNTLSKRLTTKKETKENKMMFIEISRKNFKPIFKIFRIKLVLALSNSLTCMKVMVEVWFLFYGGE